MKLSRGQTLLAGVVYLACTTALAYAIHLTHQNSQPAGTGEAIEQLEKLGAQVHTRRDGSVRFIDFFGVRTVDGAVPHLIKLESVETLVLSGTDVTDEQLACVKSMPQLRVLALSSTRISDEGLAHLASISNLETLNLDDCDGFTDAGLAHIAVHKSLEKLHMNHTKITDEGIEHLLGLSKLRHVLVYNTQVTKAGAEKLQQAVPDVVVTLGE